jgi:virginiamycin B lyase
MTGRVVIAVLLVAVVAVAGLAAYFFVNQPPGPCMTLGGTKVLRSNVSSNNFDAITEYALPTPGRWANAITVAPDGSVWFGEQSVPGVGHLFTNGTLVEYPWPSASHPSSKKCGFETSIWGVAVWNGMVWGTDEDGNAIIGVNPQSGATRVINVSSAAGFPYTLSVGPDGALWFTSLAKGATLGWLGTDYSLRALHVNSVGSEFPAQLDFVSSSLAYMVVLNNVNASGGVYSFNPSAVSPSIDPQRVGGGFRLQAPDSVAVGAGKIWVAQHGPSNLATYNAASGGWTLLPTTSLGNNITTLPYFVSYGAGGVWFNEHYGNRIGFINQTNQLMTEYSEANPPVTNESLIGNDLTIVATPGGAWFTSTTGDYIGFASASYLPGFSISSNGGSSITVKAGGREELNFTVTGDWGSSLSVIGSDAGNYTAAPGSIALVPSTKAIAAGSGPMQLQVQVAVSSKLGPGEYTLAVTLSDGLVLRTAFVFLNVS